MKLPSETIEESLTYRQAMKVTEVCVYRDGNSFAICPRCDKLVEIEHQLYCSSCGQRLEWRGYCHASPRYV